MNNVAALQNQLALDVAQRMQSIEDLLDGKNAAPSKPDPDRREASKEFIGWATTKFQ